MTALTSPAPLVTTPEALPPRLLAALDGRGERLRATVRGGLPPEERLRLALDLAYAEAELAGLATSGAALPTGLTDGDGSPGPTLGGRRVRFDGEAQTRAVETIAEAKRERVRALRRLRRLAKPTLNLGALAPAFGSPRELIAHAAALEAATDLALGAIEEREVAGALLDAPGFRAPIFGLWSHGAGAGLAEPGGAPLLFPS